MEKKMENEMETGVIWGIKRGFLRVWGLGFNRNLGFRVWGLGSNRNLGLIGI